MSRTRVARAGTQKLHAGSERWAPALQRTVEETLRCVRGTPKNFIHSLNLPVTNLGDQWTDLCPKAAAHALP